MFQRISNLIRGFLSLFISGLEKSNPEALLEVEKENLRKQIAQYNQGLASHAALCERLMSQVKAQTARERELKAKTSANLKAGNRDAAAQYALELQGVQRDLKENQAQLEQAETTYEDLIKARDVSIKAAQAKIEGLKNTITDMRMKQATAEMSEMASGMISSIGGAGDTLSRLQEMVGEERDKAAGRARIARDSIDMTEVKVKDSEQKALADQALADFAAQEGLVLDNGPVSAAAPSPVLEAKPKTMGPAEKA